MENIRCTVERITYQNEENGWSVLRVNVKGYKDVVTLVGNFCDTKVGAVLAVEGNWRMDAKFGKQFQAVNWKEELPSSIVGIEKYLGSGLIKGIGPVYAKKIVAKFGEETLNIIEEDIQRLSEVDGIGKKRIDLIAKSWEKQKDVKDIIVFLQGNGVSSASHRGHPCILQLLHPLTAQPHLHRHHQSQEDLRTHRTGEGSGICGEEPYRGTEKYKAQGKIKNK